MLSKDKMTVISETIRTLLGDEKPTFIFLAGDESGVYVLSNCGDKANLTDLLESVLPKIGEAEMLKLGRAQ